MEENILYTLENKLKDIQKNLYIAKEKDTEDIIKLYEDRQNWFKDNDIRQWSKYLNKYRDEIVNSIKNKEYLILVEDNKIIAAFVVKFNSIKKQLQISRLVTKVGYKKLGEQIIDICKSIAKIFKYKSIGLECLKSNDKLVKIYTEYKFNVVEIEEEKKLYKMELKI